MDWLTHAGVLWIIAAVVLAVTELALPGAYLVFFAIAAAITGALALAIPALGLPGQLIGFALWSAIAVLIGRRWYVDFPVPTSDPMLNDRVARLLGETVTVVEPIAHGQGRVQVGDGQWLARGPDLPAGTRVRITGAQGATLTVEPIAALDAPSS